MAYIQVTKDGKLIRRRWIDNSKAMRGCSFRFGSHGNVSLKIGQTIQLDQYEITLVPADEKPEKSVEVRQSSASHADTLNFSKENQTQNSQKSVHPHHIEGYDMLSPLGQGGMGIVYKAVQLSTKREVALKFLRESSVASGKAHARFEREVALSAQLTHSNIARIYDSGLHRGVYYYAMEFIDGVHLDQYVVQQGLDESEILVLFKKTCMAVEYAHSKGIIHRDLKPSNILITEDGEPHILDFGLAKARDKTQGDLTLSVEGQITGTPSHMSPEQAGGHIESVDERSDVYSLGVILYRLLTGTMPHDMTGKHYEVLRRIAEEDIIRPRHTSRRIDRNIESLLLKALARQPQGRYSSAMAFALDIDNYINGEPLQARGITLAHWMRKHRIQLHRIAVSLLFIGIAVAAALIAGSYILDRSEPTIMAITDLMQAFLQNQNKRSPVMARVRELPDSNLPGHPNQFSGAGTFPNAPFIQIMPNDYHDPSQQITTQNEQRMKLINTSEKAARRLIDGLDKFVNEEQWQLAQDLLQALKEHYNHTEEFRRQEAHIVTCERKIRKGLTSSQ